MRAGTLRHRVTFQTRDTVRGEFGGAVDTWTDTFPDIAASIVPQKGRETTAAGAVQNESLFLITTRYFDGFDPIHCAAMRIVFGARVFNIIDPSNIQERNRELQFLVSEGLAKG